MPHSLPPRSLWSWASFLASSPWCSLCSPIVLPCSVHTPPKCSSYPPCFCAPLQWSLCFLCSPIVLPMPPKCSSCPRVCCSLPKGSSVVLPCGVPSAAPPPQLQCSLVLLLVLLAPVHPPVYLFLSVIPESPCRFDLHMALVTQTEQGAESACTSVVLGSEARAAKSLSSRRGKQGGCGSWAGCSPSALDFVFLLS